MRTYGPKYILAWLSNPIKGGGHSVVVSLWDVTESLYIEISRSDGPQKGLADVDLTHLKSYGVIYTISIAVLGHSKLFFISKD